MVLEYERLRMQVNATYNMQDHELGDAGHTPLKPLSQAIIIQRMSTRTISSSLVDVLKLSSPIDQSPGICHELKKRTGMPCLLVRMRL